MFNRLKYLPWRSLIVVALLTVAIATVLDLLLVWAIQSAVVSSALSLVRDGILGAIMQFLVNVGIGALAVYLLERWQGVAILSASTLWALVPCVMLVLFLKSLLIPSAFFLEVSRMTLVGVVVGIFWKGRPYWH
ncbi:peptide chain release factor 1 [Kamptonema cortianum]|uniref:Peptide chain release factor 1 n=1 Tax=Geitlerinema calcuttense NRMC-F 0142 TaxID=2922238 RepID=A0ABT7LYN3_9CYAN|nr:peptide chain release factor 1 [Geitlerinema calcuttense]MDI9640176.1 peptide chain release factor 1 [Geitlerinema splendidum]MDK3158245.1 peptide chain release factor 1 [Kamptonema cortianum]MDL5056505.1 peptide chain release factor 1 [Geitlerinema calcuttense NRMC-F 0142]